MILPLYKDNEAPSKFKNHFNAGLWHEKFFNYWSDKGNWNIPEERKIDWIKMIHSTPIGDRDIMENYTSRIVEMVQALEGEIHCFANVWHFVTGMGRDHPMENGMNWHYILGVPFLPGSSIKGIVRNWAEEWMSISQADVKRIFGSDTEGDEEYEGNKGIGSVIFFDAIPLKPVSLCADVMTPHYSEYYQGTKPGISPGDWFDPRPIFFIVVEKNQDYLFAVAPRLPEAKKNQEDCQKVMEWLDAALEFAGAGGKTSAGYGRFIRRHTIEMDILKKYKLKNAEESLERKAVLESSSASKPVSLVLREMEDDGYSSDPEGFMSAVTLKWLKKLEQADTAAAEKKEIAQLLKKWYQTYRINQWEKPNKKNAKKIKLIKEVLEA